MTILTSYAPRPVCCPTPILAQQSTALGEALIRLRQARKIKQSEAALRAGLARSTAQRLEHGDAGVALGVILRYLNAIAPGLTLVKLLTGDDPALRALEQQSHPQRVRDLTTAELKELDF